MSESTIASFITHGQGVGMRLQREQTGVLQYRLQHITFRFSHILAR